MQKVAHGQPTYIVCHHTESNHPAPDFVHLCVYHSGVPSLLMAVHLITYLPFYQYQLSM